MAPRDMVAYDAVKLADLCSKCASARGNHAKGETMADLVEYAFSQVSGLTLRHRGYTYPDHTAEIDLVFSNRPFISQLPTSGVTLFVECKNEARKIAATQVRSFSSKLRDRNQRMGLMVSRTGLSGRNATHAHGVIAREMQDGHSILVLTMADLSPLVSTDDLVRLCQERLEELEYQGTYTSL